MKIVRLSNRFNAKKKYGCEIGVKFTSYWDDGGDMERTCNSVLGKSSFLSNKQSRIWYAEYSSKRDSKTGMHPYWIYFKKESHLTMVLLKLRKDD